MCFDLYFVSGETEVGDQHNLFEQYAMLANVFLCSVSCRHLCATCISLLVNCQILVFLCLSAGRLTFVIRYHLVLL